MVEHPAGYTPLLAQKTSRAGVVVAFDEIQLSRHPGSIGFGAAVPWPARSHAYASLIPFLESAQGLLPARAGSPLAGRISHPLDDERSFMKASPPPIPFDQQGLVALEFLSALSFSSCVITAAHVSWPSVNWPRLYAILQRAQSCISSRTSPQWGETWPPLGWRASPAHVAWTCHDSGGDGASRCQVSGARVQRISSLPDGEGWRAGVIVGKPR
jgi:hypothetical protein